MCPGAKLPQEMFVGFDQNRFLGRTARTSNSQLWHEGLQNPRFGHVSQMIILYLVAKM